MKSALVAIGLAAALGVGVAAAWLVVRPDRLPTPAAAAIPRSGPATGSVAGVVKWTGPVPVERTDPVTRDHAACGEKVRAEDLLVGRNGELENALVSVEGVTHGSLYLAPPYPIAFDISGCLFRERLTVVPSGAKIEVRNRDSILHNAHFNATRGQSENFAIPAGMRQTYAARVRETIKVTCDIHPWMAAYVIVRDDPYFAVTKADGHFVIRDVPTGRRRVRVWHERVGAVVREVDVAAGAEATLYLEIAPP